MHDPIHFTSNGTVIHQSNEILKALKQAVAESDMITGIKYIAAVESDGSHVNAAKRYVILKYDAFGVAKKISSVAK